MLDVGLFEISRRTDGWCRSLVPRLNCCDVDIDADAATQNIFYYLAYSGV